MRRRTVAGLRAIACALTLTGTYFWFRVDQARQQREAAVVEAAERTAVEVAGSSITRPAALMPSSKSGVIVQPPQPKSNFSDLARNLNYTYEHPYATSNPSGSGFKLSNSVSEEFAVGADICPGLPDPMPPTPVAAQPATAPPPPSSERSRQR